MPLIEVIEEAKDGKVLVFVATKRNTEFLAKQLQKYHYHATYIHGGKTQSNREIALKNFKTGRTKILIATDIASRGLQIDNVEYVVNYNLANDLDTHKHRIGRTGRMGKTGHAITFVGEDGNIIAENTGYTNKQRGRHDHSKSGRFSGRNNYSQRKIRAPKFKRRLKRKYRHNS